MPATKKLLAFDLGAESGRGLLGRFDGGKLQFDVVHRFANGPVKTLDAMHWDVLSLYKEMLNAMSICARDHGGIDSVGVDTWGVDFGLLGKDGSLLGNPRAYRDPHTETIMEETFARVPKLDIFQHTGIQFMRFNTLFQLLAMQRDSSPVLENATTLLFMPDLFHYWLTGVKCNEFTDASTSQMLDPHTGKWAYELMQKCGLPDRILGDIVPPGTQLGMLRSSVAMDTGLRSIPVIAPATHDTGSAVAAVPGKKEENWAYISSGTWSLMGAEIDKPLVNEKALSYNFTNEGGFGQTIRFLKNIMGLWLVQECRRSWQRAGEDFSYEQLMHLASKAKPFASLVDPDHASFVLPGDMPAALADFCRKTNQPTPIEPAAFVRCALESLALRYRWVFDRLEELLGQQFAAIHIVGGGCQNTQLCQFTADACNRPVYAGPVEATAIGNLLVQAIGLGLIGSLGEGREVVRTSFELTHYEPKDSQNWDAQYERFQILLQSG